MATGAFFTPTCGLTELKGLNNIFSFSAIRGTDRWKQDLISAANQGKQHVFVWLTMEEFERANQTSDGVIQVINGDYMSPKWSHIIGTTTLHDCLTACGFQLSQLHALTSNMNKFVMVIWEIDAINHLFANKSEKVNVFNRGCCTTQLQFFKSYRLSDNELKSQQVIEVSGPISGIFQQYSWKNGFVWNYNLCINVKDALDVENDLTHWVHYPMKQALQYSGLNMIHRLDQQVKSRVIAYCTKFDISLSVNPEPSEARQISQPK